MQPLVGDPVIGRSNRLRFNRKIGISPEWNVLPLGLLDNKDFFFPRLMPIIHLNGFVAVSTTFDLSSFRRLTAADDDDASNSHDKELCFRFHVCSLMNLVV